MSAEAGQVAIGQNGIPFRPGDTVETEHGPAMVVRIVEVPAGGRCAVMAGGWFPVGTVWLAGTEPVAWML